MRSRGVEMPPFFLNILLVLTLATVGSYGTTVADILAFQKKLNSSSSESSQTQETAKLAELLSEVDPADIFKETNPNKIDIMLTELFKLKQAIRTTTKTMDPNLVKYKKLSLTRIRYLEDYVAERRLQIQRGPDMSLNVNSILDGDILLLRGGSSVSPAVARIGETPSVYSHIGIVHVDQASGKKYIVESLPRIGVVANPIESLLSNKTPRVSVYRSDNFKEAKLAAEMAFQMANYTGKNTNPFDFDFTMNLDFSMPTSKNLVDGKTKYSFDISDIKSCRFFCSKLISYVFFEVGNSEKMPQFKSRFRSSIDELKIAVGVNPDLTETFLPGDFEFETGFTLISEYRNTSKTLDSRIDDIIIDEIYNKISFQKKSLKATRFQRLVAATILSVTARDSTNKLLRAIGIPMSTSISAKLITTLYNLDRILSIVKKELFLRQGIGGKPLGTRSFSEIRALVKNELETNAKIGKFFIDAPARTRGMCLNFYVGQ